MVKSKSGQDNIIAPTCLPQEAEHVQLMEGNGKCISQRPRHRSYGLLDSTLAHVHPCTVSAFLTGERLLAFQTPASHSITSELVRLDIVQSTAGKKELEFLTSV